MYPHNVWERVDAVNTFVNVPKDNIPADVFPLSINYSEDITQVWNQRFDIYDDNKHSQENVPDVSPPTDPGLKEEELCGWNGVDHHSIITVKIEQTSYNMGLVSLGPSYHMAFLPSFPSASLMM